MMPAAVRRADAARAASRPEWIAQNRQHLHELYAIVQRANEATGRRVFDRLTLQQWCELAYVHSTIYSTLDAYMYDDDTSDDD